MKKIILATLLLFGVGFMVGVANAGDITVSGVNLKDLVSNTRVGVWIPLTGGATFKTLYTPLLSLHSVAGTEYAVFDVGGAAPGDIDKGYAFIAIGLRIDTLLDRAIGSSKWIKTHVSAVSLPTIEVGVGPLMYQNKIRWGVNAALKF